MNVELVEYTPNPEETIEKAARICYDSDCGTEEKRKKFLTGLVKSGHTSTIEHVSASFRISGVSRALTHELVRHRIGFSYSQRSQRYCSEDGFNYVVPDTLGDFGEEYRNLMDKIGNLYGRMVKSGIPKEDARYVLPNACHTEFFVTANFRAWRNFLELRLSPRAQWEIRSLAKTILEKLHTIAPTIFDDYYIREFKSS